MVDYDLDEALVDFNTLRQPSTRRKYPTAYPGNVRPTASPDYSMFILYEIFRGRNLDAGFKRMVKMMTNIDDVNDVMREFISVGKANPDMPDYLKLARAMANVSSLDFTYESSDEGNIIRVWRTAGVHKNEEFNFEMRRGVHRRRNVKRDYSRYIKPKARFLTVDEILRSRKFVLKAYRKKR